MDSQYKLLSELLSDQAAFITSPKTSLANYWGALPPRPPSVYGPGYYVLEKYLVHTFQNAEKLNFKIHISPQATVQLREVLSSKSGLGNLGSGLGKKI